MHEGLRAIADGQIARWKVESEEELKLAMQADESALAKKAYCEFYRSIDPEYYDKGVEMAKSVILSHEGWKTGIPEDKMIEDMVYSLHRFGFSFPEYFWFKLYNLSTFGREGFISDKMRYEYYIDLNTKEGCNLLRDKGRTYERLAEYYQRDCLPVYSSGDKERFQAFVNQHNQFFYKPLAADSAKNCCAMDREHFDFEQAIAEGPFIVEELIKQQGDYADFYPDAVNLIRIPVLTTKDGQCHLMGPFITLGQNGMKAVNAGVGGIVGSIDPETGVIIGNGWMENNEKEFAFHPESGKRIIGYQIPDWNDAVAICKEAAQKIPECKYIGFDLAQTEKGWIIIEANCYAQFLGQRNTMGLRRKMLELLENV